MLTENTCLSSEALQLVLALIAHPATAAVLAVEIPESIPSPLPRNALVNSAPLEVIAELRRTALMVHTARPLASGLHSTAPMERMTLMPEQETLHALTAQLDITVMRFKL